MGALNFRPASVKVAGGTASDKAVHRLAAAVLLQAVRDINGSSVALQYSALQWTRSSDQSTFSFCWVCAVLNLNPRKARRICARKATEQTKSRLAVLEAPLQHALACAALRPHSFGAVAETGLLRLDHGGA